MNTQTAPNLNLSKKTDTSPVQQRNKVSAALYKHLPAHHGFQTDSGEVSQLYRVSLWPLYSWPGIFLASVPWDVTVLPSTITRVALQPVY